MALFSWSVTHAVFESSETVMYSGSISFTKSLLGPKTLKPLLVKSANWLEKAEKFTVFTA